MPRQRGASVSDLFGTYVLPGRIKDPAIGIAEAQDAEKLGLGAAWLSERFALKECGVVCGALAQATTKMRIAGTLYAHNRHPITTASLASTMQALSGNRFVLVMARGARQFFEPLGLPHSNFALMADTFDILHRLWAGEQVTYNGPAGNFTNMQLVDRYEGSPPPIVLTATGPKALAFAGAHCDGVILQPFLTPDGVAKATKVARDGAERAGRDPDRLRVYGTIVTAPDLPADEEEAIVGGRAVTYFQIKEIGELTCSFNDWDPAVFDRLREHQTFATIKKGEIADLSFFREQLVEASRIIPREWLAAGGAVGTSAQCAAKMFEFLDAGADEIVLHGAAPRQMAAMVDELSKLVAAGR